MRATTDSEMLVKYDPDNKPGISNLLNIYIALTGKTMKEAEKEFEGCNYGTFKTKVADVVVEKISEIQKKYYEILNGNELDKILEDGKNKSREIAKKKYELVKEKIGFYN